MILTVTPNLALDVTYRVAELVPEASVRVESVAERAGGKGVNVARVLQALGAATAVTGFVGGATGAAVRRDLAASGLVDELVAIDGETRRTVAVVDAAGGVTILLEPGPVVTPPEWHRLLDRLGALADRADAIVLSGSLPRGLPADASAELVRACAASGRPVLLDASGDALVAGLAARPAVVKPNRAELYEATGGPAPAPDAEADLADVVDRAAALRARGAGAVVVSLGRDGMLALVEGGAWHASLEAGTAVSGNPTGAGDAGVAALALGLVRGEAWPALLREAVAISAAAVLHPLAGGFDAAALARLRGAARVRELVTPTRA